MSERNISISTYAKADNLIDLKGYISLDGIEEKIEIPQKKHLILYNYSLSNGDIIVPRKFNAFRIFLKPVFTKGHSQNDFHHLIFNNENSENVLKVRLQVWCKTTRWCSNQITLALSEANGRKEIYFDIPTSEVKEEVVVSGFVVREKEVMETKREKQMQFTLYFQLVTIFQFKLMKEKKLEVIICRFFQKILENCFLIFMD